VRDANLAKNTQYLPLNIKPKVEKIEIDPYQMLIATIPEEEREIVLYELDKENVIKRAELLCQELSENKFIGLNLKESRTLFLALLRNLREKKISENQLATNHFLNSAIYTLCIKPMMYFIFKYVDANNNVARKIYMSAVTKLEDFPTSIKKCHYGSLHLPKDGIEVSDLPLRMQKPLMQRFFNFTDGEWNHFTEEMSNAPVSERYFYILITPKIGCWSSIISKIQEVLTMMQVLDRVVDSNEGFITEPIMPVPSFSMFQAAINAKAKTLGRKSVEFVPTYGYLKEESYARLKSLGKIAMTLYLPEVFPAYRYQNNIGRFRTVIDGHPGETAFAGAIHDFYHGIREIAMTEGVSKARFRLASIAKKHPNNRLNLNCRRVDEILVDGELVHSYPSHIDTCFKPESRSSNAECFGELFYVNSLRHSLHENLKRDFIKDMVFNKKLWKEQYNLGKLDLLEVDQKIYDEIELQRNQKLKGGDGRGSHAMALNRIGMFDRHSSKDSECSINSGKVIYNKN